MIEIIKSEFPSPWKKYGACLLDALNEEINRSERSGYSVAELYQDERTLVGLVATALARSEYFNDSVIRMEVPLEKKGGGGGVGRADLVIAGGGEKIHDYFSDKKTLWIEAKRHREDRQGPCIDPFITWFGNQRGGQGDSSIKNSLMSRARRDYRKATNNDSRVTSATIKGMHFGVLLFCLIKPDEMNLHVPIDESAIVGKIKAGFVSPRIAVAVDPAGIPKGMRIRRRPTVVSTYKSTLEESVLVASFTVLTELSTTAHAIRPL